jgi:hypothetical protein
MMYLLLASLSNATPLQYNHQGRLLDTEGNGLSGDHELTFRIVDESDGVLWEESLDIEFQNGYYSVHLGEDETNNPLDDTIFVAYPLWMELSVDGDTLEPRHPIQSVPYANIAGMAETLDGGSVNASDISVNGTPVVDADGNWVGTNTPWENIDGRPSGLDDGDDDTQLTQTQVVDYVNGAQVNLGAASQMDGSDIVTADSFSSYLTSDILDGDADTLASLSCGLGEIASWDGNASWVCTSDSTLEWADIETMLNNNAVDLNTSTTIGGAAIVTTATDADSFAGITCQNSGEILKYDTTQSTWYCELDAKLSQPEVLGYVNGQALTLANGTQVDGSNVVTESTFIGNLPADLADGDDKLSPSDVIFYVENEQLNLVASSQVDGYDIVTEDSYTSYLPSDLADGDDDTQLSATQVEGMIEDAAALDLSGDLAISGTATFNDAVTMENGVTVNGDLVAQTIKGPYGYMEFTTNKITSNASNNVPSYTLLDMRCSGHWGSYFVEIDLITFYYRPSVRRYEYYCGNGNHTSGGSLVEVRAPQTVGPLVSLSKSTPVDTGYDHSGIRMYDVQLTVNQSAYVQSYARVRVYGYWPSYKAGGAHSNSTPSAIWPTWTR